eukprot:c21043_g1_i1 orf=775-1470(-)
MQKREEGTRTPPREFVYVPFSWEEKPGVPKEDPSKSNLLMSLHADAYQLIPLQQPAQSPLRKPPCLQHFPPPTQPRLHSSSPRVLVRKQSFNNIITSTTRIKPLARKYSHGNLQHRPSRHDGALRMEDDPFFMAIQACRKGRYTFQEKPIKLYYHEGNVRRHEDQTVQQYRHVSDVEDFKHLTIRQLFTQQLQEEEEQVKVGQKQPLIVSNSTKKHSKWPFSFFTRCFGFY